MPLKSAQFESERASLARRSGDEGKDRIGGTPSETRAGGDASLYAG